MEPGTERTEILLVGGGVASLRCARTLRREGFTARILIVGDEATPPYNRPPLSKELLREDLADELVLAEPPRWYERRGVELRLGRTVVALDADARRAELDDGSTVAFEQALLATGARPRLPPIPGAERALLLRTLADARRIRGAAIAARSAAIIGGGLIGVEVASSLAALGVRVTVIELADRLWGGALGDAMAAWGRDRLERAGVEVRLSTTAAAVEADGVRIGSGLLEADLVVAGVGVIPNDDLAHRAGIASDDGIVTDDRHATDAPDIHAAGDVARVAGRRVEHWHAAREGGERAALAMLGLAVPPVPAAWTFTEVAGLAVDVLGEVASGRDERWLGDRVLAITDGDRLTGAAIVDGAIPVEHARRAVERGDLGELEALVRIGGD